MKYLLLICILVTAACASTAPLGIRADFKDEATQSVTLVSVFPSSTFGLPASEQSVLTEAVAAHTLRWFKERQVTAISNIEVERTLRKSGHFEDTLYAFRNMSLDEAFEIQHPAHLRGQEIDLVKTTSLPILKSAPLLFVEIVYFTEGSCRLTARGDYVVKYRSAETNSCVVAHLHAKLIAPKSAEVMWQNHVLLEDHVLPTPQTRHLHIQRAVDLLFGGQHGLLPLLN